MKDEKLVISFDREKELKELQSKVPGNKETIEANREFARIFIAQEGCRGIDLPGLARVYKSEFSPGFVFNIEQPLQMIKDLYRLWDEKYGK